MCFSCFLYVCFARADFCPSALPIGVGVWLQFVIHFYCSTPWTLLLTFLSNIKRIILYKTLCVTAFSTIILKLKIYGFNQVN